SNSSGRGTVINLVVSNDAARDASRIHVKGAAQRVGRDTSSAGTQLLAGAGHTDLQPGKANGAVASSSADIERGIAQQRASSGSDGEAHHFAGAQADGRVIAEGVTSFEHRLRAQSRAVGGRPGLGRENQLGRGSGADGNSAGVGAGDSRSGESQGNIGG